MSQEYQWKNLCICTYTISSGFLLSMDTHISKLIVASSMLWHIMLWELEQLPALEICTWSSATMLFSHGLTNYFLASIQSTTLVSPFREAALPSLYATAFYSLPSQAQLFCSTSVNTKFHHVFFVFTWAHLFSF